MTRFAEHDPEITADLRLRADSERDRTRSSLVCCDECEHHVRDHDLASGQCNAAGCECDGFVRGGGPTWSPPAIVERWPCTGCNTLVEVTQEALDVFAQMNRQLARRGERPLAKRIPCASCRARDEELAQAQRRPHEQRTIAGLDAGGKGRP